MQNTNKTSLWESPWGYSESFIFAVCLLLVGMALELFTAGNIQSTMCFPVNLIVLSTLVVAIVAAQKLLMNHFVVVWFSSIPASLTAIVLMTALSLVMGFVPQQESSSIFSRLGFTHVTSSWTFWAAALFFLLTLGFATVRRLFQPKKNNISFLLNHVGLWITIAAMCFGSGDVIRLSMNLTEHKTYEWRATDGLQVYELPIAFKLLDFSIADYNPQIGVLDNASGNLIKIKGQEMVSIVDSSSVSLHEYRVKIVSFLPLSEAKDSFFLPNKNIGAVPSALVEVSQNGKLIACGWISCGNFANNSTMLRLNDKKTLVMLPPKPKRFSSVLSYYTKSGLHDTVTVKVNKPATIGGWKVYQTGYDDRMGNWSTSSTIELVRDPWIYIIYIGIVLLIAGAISLLWKGKSFTKKQ